MSFNTELIFTTDGNIKNIVFVEELVNASPKIEGWKFTALKPVLNNKEPTKKSLFTLVSQPRIFL